MCMFLFQATVLEEMPAFPERESSILAVLKKKKPGRVPENEIRESKSPVPGATNHTNDHNSTQVGFSKWGRKLRNCGRWPLLEITVGAVERPDSCHERSGFESQHKQNFQLLWPIRLNRVDQNNN